MLISATKEVPPWLRVMTGVAAEGLENGLYFIRARYYLPEVGRFIAKDALAGNDINSQILNKLV